jgi:hypothetical protein
MKKIILFNFVCAIVLMSACKNNDPEPVNEEELITTVVLTFTPSGGGDTKTIIYRDLTPDDTNNVAILADTLLRDKTYAMTVSLLNETLTPANNVTDEVRKEATQHQFFFDFQPTNSISSFVYNDLDENGEPIGIQNKIITSLNESTGTIKVTLRHQPLKLGIGVPDGDITNAGGETDVEVSLPFVVM